MNSTTGIKIQNWVTAYALPGSGCVFIIPGKSRIITSSSTLPLIEGELHLVWEALTRHSRHTSTGTMLVPGIAEAALMDWDTESRIEAFRTLLQETLTSLINENSNPQPAADSHE